MGFSCGIIGLPNVGKSTIFNALTLADVPAESYRFCTKDQNVGKVGVPDRRLLSLAEVVKPEKVTPAVLEFRDIAGLVKGAHKGEGLGNQFLGHIRNVDVLSHVVRCFEDPNLPHEEPTIDPQRDAAVVNLELILADLQILSTRIEKLKKLAKAGDKEAARQLETLEKVEEVLDQERPAREADLSDEERQRLSEVSLLTLKPQFYVANISEREIREDGEYLRAIKRLARLEGTEAVAIIADIEAEIARLDEADRKEFLVDLGLDRSGLERMVETGYRLLNLVTFYTTVGKELRAWAVPFGTKAPRAAGRIHSDMEKGFIRAEVLSFSDFERAGSLMKARELGLLRLEGRDYQIRDGDIVTFRFSV